MFLKELLGADDEEEVLKPQTKSSTIHQNDEHNVEDSPTNNYTKEKSNSNDALKAYKDNIEELDLLVVNLFKSFEKFLFDTARGNIGTSTVRFLGSILSICFNAKKIYMKKHFFITGKDKPNYITLYKRLYNFNRTFLIQILGNRDKIKIDKLKKHLDAK